MKKILLILIPIYLLLSCLYACFIKNENKDNKQVPETEDVLIEQNEDTLIEYYKDNKEINAYLNSFNKANPDFFINSDMIYKYHHHGRDHDNQIKVTSFDGWDILIDTQAFGVRVVLDKYKAKDIEEWKEMFFVFLKGYKNDYTIEELESCWNDAWEHINFSFVQDGLDISIKANNGIIQNIIILEK